MCVLVFHNALVAAHSSKGYAYGIEEFHYYFSIVISSTRDPQTLVCLSIPKWA